MGLVMVTLSYYFLWFGRNNISYRCISLSRSLIQMFASRSGFHMRICVWVCACCLFCPQFNSMLMCGIDYSYECEWLAISICGLAMDWGVPPPSLDDCFSSSSTCNSNYDKVEKDLPHTHHE